MFDRYFFLCVVPLLLIVRREGAVDLRAEELPRGYEKSVMEKSAKRRAGLGESAGGKKEERKEERRLVGNKGRRKGERRSDHRFSVCLALTALDRSSHAAASFNRRSNLETS